MDKNNVFHSIDNSLFTCNGNTSHVGKGESNIPYALQVKNGLLD